MNRLKKVLCTVLSVCMVSLPFAVPVTVSGTEDVSSLEQQLQELENKSDEYQAVLDQANADIKEKEEYRDALVGKVEVLDQKIILTREKIQDLNESIAVKQADIDAANADIDDQLEALSNRLRILYMAGDTTDLEIILGAKDFSDLIDKVNLVKSLSECDKELIDEIKLKLDEISEQKALLEADKTELEEQEATLEADQQELTDLIEENDEILRSLYASSDDAQAALEQAALDSREIESKIQAYYAQQLENAQQNQNNNNNSNGGSSNGGNGNSTPQAPGYTPAASGYVWPTPGCVGLTSPYYEPRLEYYHGGIDIGAGYSTPVYAADSGYVFASNNGCYHNWGKYGSCGCGGGYGNYVMIDHGNGKTTIYGHFTSAVVSAGQSVSKGQLIGYVGSTGNSSGPHLHFECRYNGNKYDPLSEYPGLSVYYIDC